MSNTDFLKAMKQTFVIGALKKKTQKHNLEIAQDNSLRNFIVLLKDKTNASAHRLIWFLKTNRIS